VGLVEVVIGKTQGGWVGLEEESITYWGWEVINVAGRESHEIRGQEEKSLFIFWCNETEAVSMDCMEVFEVC
jgi:hypothetical protein